MKGKLSFFTALCITFFFVKGQISIIQNFDPRYKDEVGWHADSHGNGIYYITSPVGSTPCEGMSNLNFEYKTGEQSIGNYVDIWVLASERSQISDGKEITIKFFPLQFGEGTTDYATYYSIDNGYSWIKIEQNGASGQSPNTCSQVILKLPAGTVPTGNTTFGFKFRNIKTSKEYTSKEFTYGMVDNIVISQGDETYLSNVKYDKVTKLIYPTIFTDYIYIRNISNIKSIILFESSGKLVKVYQPTDKINLSNLTSGVYYLNLELNNNNIIKQKILKK